MLGTLFGLIFLIAGVVLRHDPEARRAPTESTSESTSEGTTESTTDER